MPVLGQVLQFFIFPICFQFVLFQARVKDADFVRIGWGAKGSTDSSMPLGLIAGGMSDGSVLFWNAKNIIE
jgi:hypothetical protein